MDRVRLWGVTVVQKQVDTRREFVGVDSDGKPKFEDVPVCKLEKRAQVAQVEVGSALEKELREKGYTDKRPDGFVDGKSLGFVENAPAEAFVPKSKTSKIVNVKSKEVAVATSK